MEEAAWRRRIRAPRVLMPQWARGAPDRLLYHSNASGKWEVYAWDRAGDGHRQVTDRREGTLHGRIDPTGEWIWWFDDTDGDELGVWMVEAFAGGEVRPADARLARAYTTGLALAAGFAVVGSATDDGNRIHLVREGDEPRLLYEHRESAWLAGPVGDPWILAETSRDDRLICLHHSEQGDSRHPDLRVLGLGGETVADLSDGPGRGLFAAGWSPLTGDNRIVVHHERRGTRQPMLWWPERGQTRDLNVDLPGEIEATWYPDGSALLLQHDHAGRVELLRLDLASERLDKLDTPAGWAGPAAVRPNGEVWYGWSNAATPPGIRTTAGGLVLAPPGERPPAGRPFADLRVGSVHAFLAEPEGPRPHPTVFLIHGGPDWHDSDEFHPPLQAWIDHGFAVVTVNYRGSTGYGQAWRDAITGNPGLTELEDIAAVRERVIAEGIVDPRRIVLAGGSWGGYLTLLGLGTQPESWSLGVAIVPVADYAAAYEDEMEPLKAYDRALFGAAPEDDAELYRKRSPITYVGQVRVPVLVLAGENDPRCPIRQVDNYLDRLRELGKPHEVLRFDAGHGSMRIDERIRHLETQIDFVSRHLGTSPPA